MKQPLPPFSCSHSANIPELLHQLGCSLIISTYQAGKVICISAPTPEKLVQLPRSFSHPMGIGIQDQRMAIATEEEVLVLGYDRPLATHYPRQPNTYDALYVPRATYYTGKVDLHDVAWGTAGLWGVNTRFSCLSLIDDQYSFQPRWKPSFITDLLPQDRCHLNGMAMIDGSPRFVSALGTSNQAEGWRNNRTNGGVILDVESGETVATGLAMPHSPRWYEEQLFVLLSANGSLVRISPENGQQETVNQFPGFVRGMDRIGDYLFIGLSKIRTTSSAFRDLPIAEQSTFAGIVVLYLPQGSIVGHIKYETSVEEIYEVKILPNLQRPGLIGPAQPIHRQALVLPETSFWAKGE